MTGIYKITSPSGKVYIGQSWNIKKRWSGHRHNAHKQPKLFASLRKYGVDAHKFEVVHELPKDVSQDTINAYEQLYMDLFQSCGIDLMNVKEAGNAGKLTMEQIEKRKGRICSPETREKIRKSLLGKEFSDVRKHNISKSRLGSKLSEEHKKKIGEAGIGRNHSEATIAKISAARSGKKRPESVGKKVSQAHRESGRFRGDKNPAAKINEHDVVEIRNKWKPREYSSIRLANEFGLSKTTVLDIVHKRKWAHVNA
jgi:group I intron endonuclease